MDNLDTYLQGTVALVSAMDDIDNKLDIIWSGIQTIRHDLSVLYQYMDTLTTGALTPTLVTPMDLCNILLAAEERIQGHLQLRLPADPKGPLWGYYKYTKVVTTIIDEYLMILLQISLVDISTSFDVYRAHNIPALHPELGVSYEYQLEGKYLVVSSDHQFFMLPDEQDIITCTLTEGHWCQLQTAMHPVTRVNWCITSVFKNDDQAIRQNCKVRMRRQTTNSTHHMGDDLWAITTLNPIKLCI